MTEVYYAKYLLRYLRCQKIAREVDDYLNVPKDNLIEEALLVAKWETVSDEIVPKWEDVSQPLDSIYKDAMNIFKAAKGSMLSKPEEQQTQECVTAIVQTIFHEWNFRCDTVANSMKTDWNELKNAYYITEVQNLKTKLKKAKLKYKFGSFTGIAMP
jgi:F-box protein 21